MVLDLEELTHEERLDEIATDNTKKENRKKTSLQNIN